MSRGAIYELEGEPSVYADPYAPKNRRWMLAIGDTVIGDYVSEKKALYAMECWLEQQKQCRYCRGDGCAECDGTGETQP